MFSQLTQPATPAMPPGVESPCSVHGCTVVLCGGYVSRPHPREGINAHGDLVEFTGSYKRPEGISSGETLPFIKPSTPSPVPS